MNRLGCEACVCVRLSCVRASEVSLRRALAAHIIIILRAAHAGPNIMDELHPMLALAQAHLVLCPIVYVPLFVKISTFSF